MKVDNNTHILKGAFTTKSAFMKHLKQNKVKGNHLKMWETYKK